jgi:thioredoxin 1
MAVCKNVYLVTDDNFSSLVEGSDVPVLLYFTATWCKPCHVLAPIVDKLAGELSRAKVAKVNVDTCPGVVAKLKIQSVPTVMVYKAGECTHRHSGVCNRAQLLRMLNGGDDE